MPRSRSPDSIKAEELYIESKGNIILKDIAKKFGVSPGTVRSWKNRYDWDNKINSNDNATLQNKKSNNKRNVAKKKKQRGGQPGNKNAVGNDGGAPLENKNAEKHGFFSKYLPEETMGIIQEINDKSPIDMLWENIQIQYAAIIRAQRIMFVEGKDEMIKELKKSKIKTSNRSTGKTSSESTEEEYEYEFQFAWDRHATFLKAQSRAMSELRNMIKRYEEMTNSHLATEEQKLRIQKLKAEINNPNDNNKNAIDDFIKATSMSEDEINSLFEGETDEEI